MAIIYSYPKVTPAVDDYLVGTQSSSSNATRNFTVLDVVEAGTGIKTVTVSLTNAQWLSLQNEFPLILAQGLGKAIRVIRSAILFDFNSTNFTWNSSIQIKYAGSSTYIGQFSVSPSNQVTQDSIYNFPENLSGIELELNKNLVLKQGGSGALGGDGTVKISITYDVVDYNNF
jgi:hypothetical protein